MRDEQVESVATLAIPHAMSRRKLTNRQRLFKSTVLEEEYWTKEGREAESRARINTGSLGSASVRPDLAQQYQVNVFP